MIGLWIAVVTVALAIAGGGVAVYAMYLRQEHTMERIDGLYAGLARLGERLSGLEASADSARTYLMRASGEIPEINIQLKRLSENIEEERRARTEPLPGDWKSGQGVPGRIGQIKQEFQRLEDESFKEMMAARNGK